MYQISKDRLGELFARIASSEELILPLEKNGTSQYGKWTPEGEVRLDRLNTVRSAKDCFFPQTENLAAFKVQGKSITVIDQRKPQDPFLVFGVRACDAASFAILDRVFLAEPVDSYYQSRRQAGTIVTLACNEPEETCFCHTFGIDAVNPGGDVSCWISGETLYWKSLTEKGDALTEKVKDLLAEGDEAALNAHKAEVSAILDKLPLKDLSLEGFGGDATAALFDRPEWAELSESCLGCGACTFVCPTCQCYDIRDFDTGHGVQRFRCWDSCMYSDFTKMAGGNPRLTQKERFRQRFMHKLVYYPANNEGIFSCVGCGRCLAKCPISMNIVKVIKTLGVKEHE